MPILWAVILFLNLQCLTEGILVSTKQRRQHVFDLLDFGAVGDGVTDNTRVFRNALYAVSGVADKGGGQLYIPPGRYVTGSFNLTSNMTLYLAKDAVILGTKDPSYWPIIAPLPSYGRGRENPGPRYSSLLFGTSIEDVVITGENGTIDGQGSAWWGNSRTGFSRGSLVELLWVKGLEISNITLSNPPFWTLHPVYCSKVRISQVTIISPSWSPGTDGIVPDSCRDVRVERTFIRTGGDCISIKSGWDEYGIAVGIPSQAIRIDGVVLESPKGVGISVGSEMSGGVGDVTVRNAHILNSRVGISVETARGRGGFVRGISFESVLMEDVEMGVQMLSASSEHPDDAYDPRALPEIRGLNFTNVLGFRVGKAGALNGLTEAPFEDVKMENVTFELKAGGSGFACSFVNGWARNVVPEVCPEIRKLNGSTVGMRNAPSDRISIL